VLLRICLSFVECNCWLQQGLTRSGGFNCLYVFSLWLHSMVGQQSGEGGGCAAGQAGFASPARLCLFTVFCPSVCLVADAVPRSFLTRSLYIFVAAFAAFFATPFALRLTANTANGENSGWLQLQARCESRSERGCVAALMHSSAQ
jgi:hypothetical protein